MTEIPQSCMHGARWDACCERPKCERVNFHDPRSKIGFNFFITDSVKYTEYDVLDLHVFCCVECGLRNPCTSII